MGVVVGVAAAGRGGAHGETHEAELLPQSDLVRGEVLQGDRGPAVDVPAQREREREREREKTRVRNVRGMEMEVSL